MAMPAASPRRRLSSGLYSATESPSGSQSEAATPTSRGAGAHLQQIPVIPVMRRTSSGGMSIMSRQQVLHHQKSVNWSEALVASGRTSRRSEERSVKFEKTADAFAPSCPKKDDDKDHSCNGLCSAINADLNSSVSGRHVDDDATEKEESSSHIRSSVPPLLLGTT
ncbi:Hypothetical protein, putative, partial [Bodo saltans]